MHRNDPKKSNFTPSGKFSNNCPTPSANRWSGGTRRTARLKRSDAAWAFQRSPLTKRGRGRFTECDAS